MKIQRPRSREKREGGREEENSIHNLRVFLGVIAFSRSLGIFRFFDSTPLDPFPDLHIFPPGR